MTYTVRAYTFQPKEPPIEIKLWDAGANATDYGVHLWTERSMRTVGGTYEARGNLLQLDVEHNGAEPADPANPPPTAGYARLELRAGEPWLVFDWSAYAVDQIRSGMRRYLSPEYEVDKATGEIVRLVRVSLVGDPATHNARILAAAERIRAMGGCMDPKLIAAALDALVAGDEGKCAEILKGLIAQAAGAGAAPAGGDVPEAAAAPAADMPPAMAPAAGGGDAPPEEEKAMAAAKPCPVAATTPKRDPLEDVKARLDSFERDAILAKHGARLTEGQRVWASSQPVAVVKGLVEASPEPAKSTATKAGTRGATAGGKASALPPEEKAALDARMGITRIVAGVNRTPTRVTFGVLTRDDAVKILASRKVA